MLEQIKAGFVGSSTKVKTKIKAAALDGFKAAVEVKTRIAIVEKRGPDGVGLPSRTTVHPDRQLPKNNDMKRCC